MEIEDNVEDATVVADPPGGVQVTEYAKFHVQLSDTERTQGIE